MPNPLNIANNWCFWQYLWLSSIQDHQTAVTLFGLPCWAQWHWYSTHFKLSFLKRNRSSPTNRSVCNVHWTWKSRTERFNTNTHILTPCKICVLRYMKNTLSADCRKNEPKDNLYWNHWGTLSDVSSDIMWVDEWVNVSNCMCVFYEGWSCWLWRCLSSWYEAKRIKSRMRFKWTHLQKHIGYYNDSLRKWYNNDFNHTVYQLLLMCIQMLSHSSVNKASLRRHTNWKLKGFQ